MYLRARHLALAAALVTTACADSGGGGTTPYPDATVRPQDGSPGGGMIPSGDMGGSTGGDPTGGTTGGDPTGGTTGGDPTGGSTGGAGGEPVGGEPVGGSAGGAGGEPVGGSTGGAGGAAPADLGLPPDMLPDVPPPPDLGRLVINEIDYDQVSADEAEYLEILNTADAPARLRGKVLELVNGSNRETYGSFDLGLAGDELPPGGYLVVGAQVVLDALPEGVPGLLLEGGIQNGAPDGARIVDTLEAPARFVDGVSWEGSLNGIGEGNGAPGDVEAGPGAIGRCPDGADTDDNATDFVQIVGTPGAVNVCPPPAPRLLTLEIEPSEVPARSPFALTVTLDLPAGPDGLPLVFDFTPATGARGPEVGFVDAGEEAATFEFFAGAAEGEIEVVVESPELGLSAEGTFTIIAPLPVERVPLVINEVDVDHGPSGPAGRAEPAAGQWRHRRDLRAPCARRGRGDAASGGLPGDRRAGARRRVAPRRAGRRAGRVDSERRGPCRAARRRARRGAGRARHRGVRCRPLRARRGRADTRPRHRCRRGPVRGPLPERGRLGRQCGGLRLRAPHGGSGERLPARARRASRPASGALRG
jgi:hypothetical protein